MREEIKYVTNYRWYMVVNYLVALGEQIALFHYGYMTFFWWALAFNVLGTLASDHRLGKLEKKYGLIP